MDYPVEEKLLAIPIFKEESRDVISWLLDNSEYKFVKAGSYFFKKGDPVEHMFVILDGELNFMVEAGGNFLKIGSASRGDITGVLPFSRMKEAGGSSEVVNDVHCLAFHKDKFSEMDTISPGLVQNLVGLMSDRVRNFTMRQQQREKMEALGKMSAGIAHELNNPASAIRSTSRDINNLWEKQQKSIFELISMGFDSQKIVKLQELVQEHSKKDPVKLSMMDKSDLEDEMIDYLDDIIAEDGLELAEDLVDKGFDQETVKKAREIINDDSALAVFLKWLVQNISLREMFLDINEASERISNLVASIKSHSHMDRAPEESELDIQKGLESTLVIFQHKIKEKNIKLDLNFEEQPTLVKGMEGELNQVWTNIIDNALDALNEGGTLGISTLSKDKYLLIQIKDNGPGIPEKIVNQIFEPFFTTKDLGKGTGLGLDISSRIIKEHEGLIDVKSKPGETVFEISLPIDK